MACVFLKDECETKAEDVLKRVKDTMKVILNKCEDEDGYKGEGSVREISRLMKNFEDQW